MGVRSTLIEWELRFRVVILEMFGIEETAESCDLRREMDHDGLHLEIEAGTVRSPRTHSAPPRASRRTLRTTQARPAMCNEWVEGRRVVSAKERKGSGIAGYMHLSVLLSVQHIGRCLALEGKAAKVISIDDGGRWHGGLARILRGWRLRMEVSNK